MKVLTLTFGEVCQRLPHSSYHENAFSTLAVVKCQDKQRNEGMCHFEQDQMGNQAEGPYILSTNCSAMSSYLPLTWLEGKPGDIVLGDWKIPDLHYVARQLG